MSFGRSRARRVEAAEQPVTFDDVAGIDEAKEELTEIVDFLKNPDKYLRLGGRIPRGVLLSGAPGTGKTLLARAVAGEAGVPFFQMSASEFVEMIVGVGASRVRDLFQQAKAAAPAIIFIDELDAIGRSRAAGGPNISGGHDEREQTLNQILTEMDGFDPRSGVIVLAATNRPEILDPALLRPGPLRPPRVRAAARPRRPRGDPPRPHALGAARRRASTSARSPPRRPGWSAPTWPTSSTRRRCWPRGATTSRSTAEDLSDALERIVLGAERKVMLTEDDRRRTAYHEAGHAIVGMLTPGADPVRKVSIIPRGQALGVTFSAPDADRFNFDEALPAGADQGRARRPRRRGDRVRRPDHRRRVRHPAADPDRAPHGRALGHEPRRSGRSRCSRRDGMGPLLPGASETSEATQRMVDEEVRRIVETAHAEVDRPAAQPPRRTSTRWSRRCSSARRSTRPTPTRPPACPATHWRAPEPVTPIVA